MLNKMGLLRDLLFKNKFLILLLLGIMTLVSFLIILVLSISLNVYSGRQALSPLVSQHVRAGTEIMDKQLDRYDNLEGDSRKANQNAANFFKYVDYHFNYGIRWRFPVNDSGPTDLWTVNQNCVRLYQLQPKTGHQFKTSDFQKKSTFVPVMVGHDLKDRYRLGHHYQITDENSHKRPIKVIGILKRSASIQNLYELTFRENLNQAIVKPLTIFDKKHLSYDQISDGAQDLLIFGKHSSNYPAIQKKAQKLKIAKLRFYTVRADIRSYMKTFKPAELMFGVILLLLVIGTGLLVMWNLVRGLKRLAPEINARLISGLSRQRLLREMLLSQFIIVFVSWLISVVIMIEQNRFLLSGNGLKFWSTGFLGLQATDWVSIGCALIIMFLSSLSGTYLAFTIKTKRGVLK